MESREISFPYIPEKAGIYKFAISLHTSDRDIMYVYPTKEIVVAEGEKIYPDITDIDLGFKMTVENEVTVYDAVKGDYDIYGNTLRGKLTITNPNTQANYKGSIGVEVRKTFPEFETTLSIFKEYTIPAGDSIDIPIVIPGMTHKDYYIVSVTYYQGNKEQEWYPWKELAYFYKRPTIVVNMADGTELEFNPKSLEQADHFTIPAQAVSVDFRATGVTNITTEDGNPYIVYRFNNDDQVPDGLKNVLLYDVASKQYTTEKIEIEDGYNFAMPVDITASAIEFTYHPDRWADKNGGWNTLILPFDVTSVTADGTSIDWFRSSTDKDKQFWLKEFVSDEVDAVNFADVSESMTANTPYLIALPGEHWGTAYDLSKKTIKFIGSGEIQRVPSKVLTAGHYNYMGNTAQDSTANIYTLNAAGTQFELSNGSAPFRAYFRPISFDPNVTRLNIGCDERTMSVREVENHEPSTNSWYTIDGRRLISKPNTKGIYIVDGKKLIVK